jgi:hypothetical protein
MGGSGMKLIAKSNRIYNIKNNLFTNIDKIVRAGNNGNSIVIPHVCNNVDVFGSGFAEAITEKYPIVKQNYHMLGLSFLRNNMGYVQFVEVFSDKNYGHKLIFANMIAQKGTISRTNIRPLHYPSLVLSMISVQKFIKAHFTDNKIQIHCPKFGSGLAGGNWLFISSLIEDIWTDIDTFVYSYKK